MGLKNMHGGNNGMFTSPTVPHTTPLTWSTCHAEYGQPVLLVLDLLWDLTVPLNEFKGLQSANQEFRDLLDLSGQAQVMLYEDFEVGLPL
jgi:hypothetical protein